MTMKKRWIAAGAAALLLPVGLPRPAAAQEPTPEQIVAQFFPQRLITESEDDHAAGGPLPFQASDFEVVDLQGDGSAFIVAAYTNGFSGVVRALRKVGADWQVADEPDLPRLGGVFPSLSLVEIDADGPPEVLVSLSSARGPSADWVFDWDGSHLRPVNPTVADDDGEIDTALSDADLLDLDGDGRAEMINPTGSGPVAEDEVEPIGFGDYEVFAFDGERYVPAGNVSYFGTATRQTGAPVTERIRFTVQPPGAYRLHIVNGTASGDHRVSSAVIRLNGDQVAGPGQFNQNVAHLDIAVSLQEENLLEIELRGRPGGRLTYIFQPAS
jgi:hypothetical protein